jgi:hypothetical protein
MTTTYVGNLPVDEYMDGSRTFWITRERECAWTLWCKVGSANLSLLGADMRPLEFDQPQQCVGLFQDHSDFEREWTSFEDRVAMHEPSRQVAAFDAALGDARTWLGSVNIPSA